MSRWRTAVTLLGGAALLGATATDALSVIGRNVGLPLRGSIELVQLAVLIAGSLALLVATIDQAHAKVHLLVDRMSERASAVFGRVSALLGALFFGALLAGSLWLMADLWNGHEQSEVLGIPWRWMRVFANAALLITTIALLRQALGKRS